jgi:hypothetical protein
MAENATVLVDARNVQRSQWPNLPDEELVERARVWAERHDADAILVFDGRAPGGVLGERRLDARTTVVGTGGESADDWLTREAPNYQGAWLVTSDRELRERAGSHTSKIVGGGSFLRELLRD